MALSALLGAVRTARAQQHEPVVEVEARSTRAIAAMHGEDPTAAGTSLDLTRRTSLPRSLGEVVREAPGAHVTNTGGMGAFSAASLRGGDSEETLVLLGAVPLTTPDGGAFDLSLFPAELFGKVTAFRSGAPVWLGSGAIGGVLQLAPRKEDASLSEATVSLGSFDTHQVSGRTALALPSGLSSHTQLVLRGTRGDYPYRDDRGTRFDASDDLTLHRKNADFMEASGIADLTVPVGRGTLQLLALGLQRGGGFPGPGSQPTPKIRRDGSRAILAAAYSAEQTDANRRGGRLELVASGAYGAERFTDRFGQLGTSKQTARDDRSGRTFLRAAGSLRLAHWLESTLVSSYALDVFRPRDAYVAATGHSARHTAAVAGELAVRGRVGRARFELRPSGRLEWSRTAIAGAPRYAALCDGASQVLAKTLRIGVAMEPVAGVALSASAATGMRLPSVLELFGDGGLMLPSLGLRPVSSTTYDGGLTLRGRTGPWHGSTELRAFHQERRDLIATYRTAQHQLGHENVASVRQRGGELHAGGGVGEYIDVTGSLTVLQTETALGKQLPLRPRFLAYIRPEARRRFDRGPVSSTAASVELSHRSYAFVDAPNLAYTEACLKIAVGGALGLFGDRLRLSARIDDVADARCTDLVGFPLPGRSLFFSVSYREVVHDSP